MCRGLSLVVTYLSPSSLLFVSSLLLQYHPCQSGIVHPSCYGVNKRLLDELLFYSIPSLLEFSEVIARRFGGTDCPDPPQAFAEDPALSLAPSVSLREFISGLIIASTYVACLALSVTVANAVSD